MLKNLPEMRIIDRIELLKKQTGLNDNQISVDCGLSKGLLANSRRSPKRDLGKISVERILNRYKEINRAWLVRGEGEMFIKNSSEENLSEASSPQTVKNSENSIELFASVLSVLKAQLEAKDKQIDRLLSTLDRLSPKQ
jgi:hypothetical protein